MAGEDAWGSLFPVVNPVPGGGDKGADAGKDGDKKPKGKGDGKGKGEGSGKNGKSLSPEEMAAQYGYAWAKIQGEPDLIEVFEWAAKQGPNLTQDGFNAKLRATDWWQSSSDTWRTVYVQEHSNDQTWSERILPDAAQKVRTAAGSLGVALTDAQVNVLATQSLYGGWSPERLTSELVRGNAGSAGLPKNLGDLQDDALTTYRWLQDLAKQNGVSFNQNWFRSQVSRILDPLDEWSTSDVSELVFQKAKEKFPTLVDEIGQFGKTPQGQPIVTNVRDALSPYLIRIAEGLDLSVDEVSLDDPLIEKTLTTDGKMSMWDLQQAIRQDDRWFNTAEAVSTFDSMASNLAAKMGVVG